MKRSEVNKTHCPISKLLSKAGRPKSEQKRVDILFAASELFLNNGFSSTSMDMVANHAGVSKQTVYSHFKNKESLFTSVIDYKCSEYQIDEAHMGSEEDHPRETLIRMGNQFMSLLQDEQAIAMHRVVVGEIATNPRAAQLFYEAGPQNGIQLLSNFLYSNQHLTLSKDEARYWSIAFMNMLQGDFHLRSLLGLPYSMSEQKQKNAVTKVTDQILQMIENSRV